MQCINYALYADHICPTLPTTTAMHILLNICYNNGFDSDNNDVDYIQISMHVN